MVIAVKKFGKQRVNVRHILVIQLKLRWRRLTPLKAVGRRRPCTFGRRAEVDVAPDLPSFITEVNVVVVRPVARRHAPLTPHPRPRPSRPAHRFCQRPRTPRRGASNSERIRSSGETPGASSAARDLFRSVSDLEAAIDRFLAETNADPAPFVWTARPKSNPRRCQTTERKVRSQSTGAARGPARSLSERPAPP